MRGLRGRQPGFGRLVVVLALVSLLGGGCAGFRIHRPQDFANARQAQESFRAAALAETIDAERRRLDEVLEEELELVREHTLARRDARLLYIIGEGDSPKAWTWLEEDIAKRLDELGLDETGFKTVLTKLNQIEPRLASLEQSAHRWNVEQARDAKLPGLRCSAEQAAQVKQARAAANRYLDAFDEETKKSAKENLAAALEPLGFAGVPEKDTQVTFLEDYFKTCGDYLAVTDIPLVNQKVITEMEEAKAAAVAKTADVAMANAAYLEALKGTDEVKKEAARQGVVDAFQKLAVLADNLERLTQEGDAGAALQALGLGGRASLLDVPGLTATPLIAKLEAQRQGVLAQLASALPGDTAKVFDSLQAIGTALEAPAGPPPVTELLLLEEQLNLDLEAAAKRKAFFDQKLALLREQEEAYLVELVHLGRAEMTRRGLAKKCLLPEAPEPEAITEPRLLERLFTDTPVALEKCREDVFRLLVAYSNAWTLGRVKVEQFDYRLIALHHQAALDSSEIAFAKWQSLLGLPIDQLVALHQTGLRAEDIMSIVNALGLGAIAAGVN